MSDATVRMTKEILGALGVPEAATSRGAMAVRCPIDGSEIARVAMAGPADYAAVSQAAHAAFLRWRELPAPKRGEFVRQTDKKMRKFEREHGQLTFSVSNDADHFEKLLAWKNAQLRRSRQPEIWARPWVRRVLEQSFTAREHGFAGYIHLKTIPGASGVRYSTQTVSATQPKAR